MNLSVKIILLILLNYIDGLVTFYFIIKYGEEIEKNPIMLFLFNIFGVEIVILAKIIGITIFGIVIFLLHVKNTKMRIAHIVINFTIIVYSFICLIHITNLIGEI